MRRFFLLLPAAILALTACGTTDVGPQPRLAFAKSTDSPEGLQSIALDQPVARFEIANSGDTSGLIVNMQGPGEGEVLVFTINTTIKPKVQTKVGDTTRRRFSLI